MLEQSTIPIIPKRPNRKQTQAIGSADEESDNVTAASTPTTDSIDSPKVNVPIIPKHPEKTKQSSSFDLNKETSESVHSKSTLSLGEHDNESKSEIESNGNIVPKIEGSGFIPSIPKRPSSKSNSSTQLVEAKDEVTDDMNDKKDSRSTDHSIDQNDEGDINKFNEDESILVSQRNHREDSDLCDVDGDGDKTPGNSNTKITFKDEIEDEGEPGTLSDNSSFNDDLETVLQEKDDEEEETQRVIDEENDIAHSRENIESEIKLNNDKNKEKNLSRASSSDNPIIPQRPSKSKQKSNSSLNLNLQESELEHNKLKLDDKQSEEFVPIIPSRPRQFKVTESETEPQETKEITEPIIPSRPKRVKDVEVESEQIKDTTEPIIPLRLQKTKDLESESEDVKQTSDQADSKKMKDLEFETKQIDTPSEPAIPSRPQKNKVFNSLSESVNRPIIPSRPKSFKERSLESDSNLASPISEISELNSKDTIIDSKVKDSEDTVPPNKNETSDNNSSESVNRPIIPSRPKSYKEKSLESESNLASPNSEINELKSKDTLIDSKAEDSSENSPLNKIETNESTSSESKPKAPPPKPKKLSSKIAAFQQMFNQQNQPESQSSKEKTSEDKTIKQTPTRGKLSSDKVKFAESLRGVMGRGVPLPGMANPNSMSKSEENLLGENSEELTNEKEEGKEQSISQPSAPSRPSRAKGPRGKKLPNSLKKPINVEVEPRFKIFVDNIWEIKFEKAQKVEEKSIESEVKDDDDIEIIDHYNDEENESFENSKVNNDSTSTSDQHQNTLVDAKNATSIPTLENNPVDLNLKKQESDDDDDEIDSIGKIISENKVVDNESNEENKFDPNEIVNVEKIENESNEKLNYESDKESNYETYEEINHRSKEGIIDQSIEATDDESNNQSSKELNHETSSKLD